MLEHFSLTYKPPQFKKHFHLFPYFMKQKSKIKDSILQMIEVSLKVLWPATGLTASSLVLFQLSSCVPRTLQCQSVAILGSSR